MNIFVLDTDTKTCAQYHCDKHVVKMTLESVQILCTALNKKGFVTPYKSTHHNHPCVLWAEASYDNFCWLKNLTLALNDEYRFRFERQYDHKSINVLTEIDHYDFESSGMTEFVQAMPDRYKVHGSAIKAYRNFYLGEKMHFARWYGQGEMYHSGHVVTLNLVTLININDNDNVQTMIKILRQAANQDYVQDSRP